MRTQHIHTYVTITCNRCASQCQSIRSIINSHSNNALSKLKKERQELFKISSKHIDHKHNKQINAFAADVAYLRRKNSINPVCAFISILQYIFQTISQMQYIVVDEIL